MSLRPGEVFAGYTVERELGAGGMGSVYLARHPRLPRFDALKLLRSELCADPASSAGSSGKPTPSRSSTTRTSCRCTTGGRRTGSCGSACGSSTAPTPRRHWTTTPAVCRPSARSASSARSRPRWTTRTGISCCTEMSSPRTSCWLPGPDDDDEAERVFLSDFGVAKAIGEAAERISSLTSTGSVVATLDYASPEQIKGQLLDHRIGHLRAGLRALQAAHRDRSVSRANPSRPGCTGT